MCADECEELVLALLSGGSGLRKSGRDDADGFHAGCERRACGLEHVLAGDADDSEIDDDRDLRDVRVPGSAANRLGASVDGVRGAGEVRRQDVAEQLAADRPAARRRTDDRDGERLEERLERRGHRHVVALVAPLDHCRARSIQMQYDLDHTALQRPRRLEARVVEDSQHRGIAGEDFRDELLDTDLRRVLGEPLEQAGTDPSAVELIGDRERDFGAFRIAETDVRGERDRPEAPAVVDELADERAVARPVRCRVRPRPSGGRSSSRRGTACSGSQARETRRTRSGRPRRPPSAGGACSVEPSRRTTSSV